MSHEKSEHFLCVLFGKELKEEGWKKKKTKKKHSVTFVKSGARVDWLDSLLKSGNKVVVLVPRRRYSDALWSSKSIK